MQNPPPKGKPQVINLKLPLREAPSAQQAMVSRSDLGRLTEALRVLESLNKRFEELLYNYLEDLTMSQGEEL